MKTFRAHLYVGDMKWQVVRTKALNKKEAFLNFTKGDYEVISGFFSGGPKPLSLNAIHEVKKLITPEELEHQNKEKEKQK